MAVAVAVASREAESGTDNLATNNGPEPTKAWACLGKAPTKNDANTMNPVIWGGWEYASYVGVFCFCFWHAVRTQRGYIARNKEEGGKRGRTAVEGGREMQGGWGSKFNIRMESEPTFALTFLLLT